MRLSNYRVFRCTLDLFWLRPKPINKVEPSLICQTGDDWMKEKPLVGISMESFSVKRVAGFINWIRASQSMGQRMLHFDFVSRDPPQVGFETVWWATIQHVSESTEKSDVSKKFALPFIAGFIQVLHVGRINDHETNQIRRINGHESNIASSLGPVSL